MPKGAELYGKTATSLAVEGDYESPEEYADQGDTRVVKSHGFRYFAMVAEDVGGNPVLTPVNINRGETVTVDQIGKIALIQGERDGLFYTSEELARLSGKVEAPEELDLSAAGSYELAEWIKEKKPTIDEVMEVVGDDKDLAQRMLEAENIATDGDPRKGVEVGLTAVIEG